MLGIHFEYPHHVIHQTSSQLLVNQLDSKLNVLINNNICQRKWLQLITKGHCFNCDHILNHQKPSIVLIIIKIITINRISNSTHIKSLFSSFLFKITHHLLEFQFIVKITVFRVKKSDVNQMISPKMKRDAITIVDKPLNFSKIAHDFIEFKIHHIRGPPS